MKKLFALLAAGMFILATGCQKTQEAEIPGLPENYSANINMSYDGTDTKAVLTRNSQGICGVDFVEPQILDPLSFSYENGEITAEFDDLRLSSESTQIPQKNCCTMLFEALEQVYSGAAVQSPVSNGIITYSGVTESGEFTLTQSVADGNWVEFRINDAGVDILFSEFRTE